MLVQAMARFYEILQGSNDNPTSKSVLYRSELCYFDEGLRTMCVFMSYCSAISRPDPTKLPLPSSKLDQRGQDFMKPQSAHNIVLNSICIGESDPRMTHCLLPPRERREEDTMFVNSERGREERVVFQTKTDVPASSVIREMDNSLTSVQTTIKRDLVLPRGR